MSIAAQTWAKRQRCGSATAKAVLAAIAFYADDNGLCWPSQRRLAEETEFDPKTVRAAMKALEVSGLIQRERHDRDDGSRGADRLHLNIEGGGGAAPGGAGAVPPGAGDRPGDTGEEPGGVGEQRPGGGGAAPGRELSSNYQLELSPSIDAPTGAADEPKHGQPKVRKPKTEPEPDGFPEFYSAYPRHVGRDAARKAYGRIVRDRRATPEQLLAGAQRYAVERKSENPKFTKHPATWLNDGCWQDEPASGRIKAVVSPVAISDGHRALVKRWKSEPNTWPIRMGPPPGQPGCCVPPEILVEFGVRAAA